MQCGTETKMAVTLGDILNRNVFGLAAALAVGACGGGEITRGDLYSACLEGEARRIDFNIDMALRLAPDDERESQEAFFKRSRAKQISDAEKSCECSADTLPDRIGSDRLGKVMAFYKANGTMAAKSKLNALTEAEQTEVVRCQAEIAVDRMKREGLID